MRTPTSLSPLRFTLFVFIILIGFSFRIYKLDNFDLWYDELLSVYWTSQLTSFSSFFSRVVTIDLQPPLYYILLACWGFLFGQSEFALRFFSVLFGFLSIFAIYKISTLLFDRNIGLSSAFIFSISPIHIWYAQEARGYTMATFLVILTACLLFHSLEKDKWYLWLFFIVCSVLSVYINYFSLFILPVGTLLLSVKKYRHLIKRWITVCFSILVGVAPALFILFKQAIFVKSEFWVPKPSLNSISATFENFNIGYNGTPLIYLLSFIIFSSLFILGIFYLRKMNDRLVFLSSFLFIPIGITFLISTRWIPAYISRQLIIFSPFYYISVALGIKAIRYPAFRILCIVSIIILSLFSLHNYYSGLVMSKNIRSVGVHIKKPYRPAVRYIKERFKEGDVIVHTHCQTTYAFSYYGGFKSGINQYYFVIPKQHEEYWMKAIRLAWQQGFIKHVFDVTNGIEQYNFNRMWLISSSWDRDYTLDLNSKAVRRQLINKCNQISEKWIDGILIGLYHKNE